MMLKRVMGKASFCTLQDATGYRVVDAFKNAGFYGSYFKDVRGRAQISDGKPDAALRAELRTFGLGLDKPVRAFLAQAGFAGAGTSTPVWMSHADKLKGWFVMVRDGANSHPGNALWGDGWGWSWFDAGNAMKTTSTGTSFIATPGASFVVDGARAAYAKIPTGSARYASAQGKIAWTLQNAGDKDKAIAKQELYMSMFGDQR